jgi:hypothetical protein
LLTVGRRDPSRVTAWAGCGLHSKHVIGSRSSRRDHEELLQCPGVQQRAPRVGVPRVLVGSDQHSKAGHGAHLDLVGDVAHRPLGPRQGKLAHASRLHTHRTRPRARTPSWPSPSSIGCVLRCAEGICAQGAAGTRTSRAHFGRVPNAGVSATRRGLQVDLELGIWVFVSGSVDANPAEHVDLACGAPDVRELLVGIGPARTEHSEGLGDDRIVVPLGDAVGPLSDRRRTPANAQP